jgi:hypothetical protein
VGGAAAAALAGTAGAPVSTIAAPTIKGHNTLEPVLFMVFLRSLGRNKYQTIALITSP